MNRTLFAAVALAFAIAVTPRASLAQEVGVFVDGGATFPIGDFGDIANTGWVAQAGVLAQVAPQIAVGGVGMYGSNGHDTDGDKTNLLAGFAALEWVASPGAPTPFVYAGPGYLSHKFKSDTVSDTSDSGFAVTAGAGFGAPVGSVSLFGQGFWVKGFGDVESTQIIGISAGVYIPLGGGM